MGFGARLVILAIDLDRNRCGGSARLSTRTVRDCAHRGNGESPNERRRRSGARQTTVIDAGSRSRAGYDPDQEITDTSAIGRTTGARRHEPLSGNPPATLPESGACRQSRHAERSSRQSAGRRDVAIDVCESFDAADQRRVSRDLDRRAATGS